MGNGWVSILTTLTAGLGLGTIISAVISAYIRRNYEYDKLLFDIKLSKYSCLIEALQNAVSDSSSERSRQAVVSAQLQAELVGTDEIIILSKEFYQSDNFYDVRARLVTAMKKDLRKKQSR